MSKALLTVIATCLLLFGTMPSTFADSNSNKGYLQADEPQAVFAQTSISLSPDSDAESLASAMDIDASALVTATVGASDVRAVAVANMSPSNAINGDTFALLSTGTAASISTANQKDNLTTILNGMNNAEGTDLVQLRVRVRVPSDANCAAVNFAFFTEEHPEFNKTFYRDVFTAEVGGTALEITEAEVSSPLNFAHTSDGKVISSNTQNNQFSISTNVGTTYDGASPLLTIQTSVTPEQETEFVFSIQDVGDSVYDSAVLLDNFRFSNTEHCQSGITPGTSTSLPETEEPVSSSVYLPFVNK